MTIISFYVDVPGEGSVVVSLPSFVAISSNHKGKTLIGFLVAIFLVAVFLVAAVQSVLFSPSVFYQVSSVSEAELERNLQWAHDEMWALPTFHF